MRTWMGFLHLPPLVSRLPRPPPCSSQQPPFSFPLEGGAHPEQEALQVFTVSPLLKNAIQGLHIPRATVGIPPGDKPCGRRKAGLGWEPPPPHAGPRGLPLDSAAFTLAAGTAHTAALHPPVTLFHPHHHLVSRRLPFQFPTRNQRSQVTPSRDKKGRTLTPVPLAMCQAPC